MQIYYPLINNDARRGWLTNCRIILRCLYSPPFSVLILQVSQNSELHNQSIRGPGPEDIEPERLNTAVLGIQSSGLQTSEFSQHDGINRT